MARDEIMIETTQKWKIGDCVEMMQEMPDECVDLVVTSPPYADLRDYGHDKSKIAPDDYTNWFKPIANEMFRILKPSGSFVLNVHHGCPNIVNIWCYRLLISLVDDIGFHLAQDMYWIKRSRIPSGMSATYKRCRDGVEFLWWFAKDPTQAKVDTHSVLKEYSESHKKRFDKTHTNGRQFAPSGCNVDESAFRDIGGATPFNYLVCDNNSDSNSTFIKMCRKMGIEHPARFPIDIPTFFIKMLTEEGDVVCDPFVGSGTTLEACRKTNRNGIGFEISPMYEPIIRERCMADTPPLQSYF